MSSEEGVICIYNGVFPLTKLPVELICRVLLLLSFNDRLAVSKCCHYMKFISDAMIYRDIFLIQRSHLVLNPKLSVCYDFQKIHPSHYNQIKRIDLHGDFPCDLALGLNSIRIGDTESIGGGHRAPTEQNIASKILKSNKFTVEELKFIRYHLRDLKLDNIQSLKQLQQNLPGAIKFENLKSLKLTFLEDCQFQYLEIWEFLSKHKMFLFDQISKLEIVFKGSLNLSRNSYKINMESLQNLSMINEFLGAIGRQFSNLRKASLIVEDDRPQKNNVYKKLQPDLNNFIKSLPRPDKLETLSIKLGNEFSITQFEETIRENLKNLKEFIFVGNLNQHYISQSLWYGIKLEMLHGAEVMKDFQMYGKFSSNKSIVDNSDLQIWNFFKELSRKRVHVDYLSENYRICKLSPKYNGDDFFLVKDIKQNLQRLSDENNLLSGKLRRINLNGLIFDIDKDMKTVTRCG